MILEQTVRGGGWELLREYSVASERNHERPNVRAQFEGFRIAKHEDQAKATQGGSWRSISSGHIFSSCYYSSGYPSTSHDARGFRISRKKP